MTPDPDWPCVMLLRLKPDGSWDAASLPEWVDDYHVN